MTNNKISLTGIKPTGTIHIGNYLGAIQPAIELASSYNAYYFVADYHALTTVRDSEALSHQTLSIAAAWMACGLDVNSHLFYKQSDLSELCELAWILSCYAPKGLLNRSHAYKTLVDQNQEAGKDLDKNINMGLFSYPILMAADILAFDCSIVPVGFDQKQHVEIARDIAESFNHIYGDIFVVPEPLIQESVQTIPGTDGRKMSKNYQNVIPLFASKKDRKKAVMQIATDSSSLEDPKDPESCTVFALYSLFATDVQINEMRSAYLAGGYGFGHAKLALLDVLEETFYPMQERYDALMKEPEIITQALDAGAKKAKELLNKKMASVRKAVGLA